MELDQTRIIGEQDEIDESISVLFEHPTQVDSATMNSISNPSLLELFRHHNKHVIVILTVYNLNLA